MPGVTYPPTPKKVWPICPIHRIRLYFGTVGNGGKLKCWRCKKCLAHSASTPQPYRLVQRGGKLNRIAVTVNPEEYL